MQQKNNKEQSGAGKHEHRLPQEISNQERAAAQKAHEEADKDMEADADLTARSPNDDLDEGETARLGEDKTDLI